MWKRVLLATDGSEHALEAARWVAALLAAAPETVATLVYVVARGYEVVAGEPFFLPVDRSPEELAEQSAPVVEATRRVMGEMGARAEVRVLSGPPAETIVSLAEQGGYDVIVIGRRGLSPVTRLLIGGVSERVVRLAPCPVVVIGGSAAAGATRGQAAV